MKNLSINNLYIEVTRNCTMKCIHCLRGDKEKVNLAIEHINELFDNKDISIKKINSLTITGGEPTLNIKAILQIINQIILKKIIVEKFTMVINGSIYNQLLVDALNEFYNYLKIYNTTSNFNLICSQDQFHRQPKQEILNKYGELPYFQSQYVQLSKDQILNIGRAYDNNLGNEYSKEETSLYFELYKMNNYPLIIKENDNNIFLDELYLSSKGLYSFHIIDVPFKQIDELCIYTSKEFIDKINKKLEEKKYIYKRK